MKNERLIKGIVVTVLIFVTLWFGIKPLLLGTSFEGNMKINRQGLSFEENEYATIIYGSEPEGIASALACARTGLKTLLITQDADMGSYITRTMISKMDPQEGVINKKKVLLNKGIYQEIFGKFNIGFSGEDYEKTVKKLVEEEKSLKVIYNTSILEADIEGDTLKGLIVKDADGKHYYKARNFIDASSEGDLLILCKTPYFKGSDDLGMPKLYAPLEFNFKITGVDMDALKKSQKTTDFSLLEQAVLMYGKTNPRTKIVSPSFINLNGKDLILTGLEVVGVDVENVDDMKAAYREAEEEALLLTAYLKNVLVAFKNCHYSGGPETFFIPEYRHFEGRYRLSVADILGNKDFRDKIALCSEAVDAGKVITQNVEYVVAKPHVYAIPLGSIIPSNLDNVMMTGSKASYSSLASTSAGSLPTRMTIGESAGLLSAYSFITDASPAEMLKLDDTKIKAMVSYLKRGGITLQDFNESLLIPKTEQKLMDHWSYPYIKTLAEYGIIAGGAENDFKLDFTASQEFLGVLIRNAILKMTPEAYTKELESRLKPFETKGELNGEMASAIVLEVLSVPYEKGKAFDTLKRQQALPEDLMDRIIPDKPVTTDVVLGLAVETSKKLKP